MVDLLMPRSFQSFPSPLISKLLPWQHNLIVHTVLLLVLAGIFILGKQILHFYLYYFFINSFLISFIYYYLKLPALSVELKKPDFEVNRISLPYVTLVFPQKIPDVWPATAVIYIFWFDFNICFSLVLNPRLVYFQTKKKNSSRIYRQENIPCYFNYMKVVYLSI